MQEYLNATHFKTRNKRNEIRNSKLNAGHSSSVRVLERFLNKEQQKSVIARGHTVRPVLEGLS